MSSEIVLLRFKCCVFRSFIATTQGLTVKLVEKTVLYNYLCKRYCYSEFAKKKKKLQLRAI